MRGDPKSIVRNVNMYDMFEKRAVLFEFSGNSVIRKGLSLSAHVTQSNH